jgi:hypothetical protein
VSFLVVAQTSSEVPEGLMNNPVLQHRPFSVSPAPTVSVFWIYGSLKLK